MTDKVLVIVGASGAGRRVADIALDVLDRSPEAVQFSALGVVDDDPSAENLVKLANLAVPYLGTIDEWLSAARPGLFTVGIGDPVMRRDIANRLKMAGHRAATLTAPSARVSRSATIGEGCVLSPGADISANAILEPFVHVMANSAISHDSIVCEYSNINPGAVIAGNCRIGALTTVGAGAVALQGISIGNRVVVGAAACVTSDIPEGRIVKGIPAR